MSVNQALKIMQVAILWSSIFPVCRPAFWHAVVVSKDVMATAFCRFGVLHAVAGCA